MAKRKMLPLVLVSSSPRRRELLKVLGIPFVIAKAEAEEILPERTKDATALAIKLARRKAYEVAKNFPRRLLLAADTLVIVGNRPLDKPKAPKEAVQMLRLLSGRTHRVVTGLFLVQTDGQGRVRRRYEAAEISWVTFRPLTDAEIAAYVATGEPMDKAGAYAVQGKAAIFITRIVGCYHNVVGLPLAKLAILLRQAGVDITEFWESG